MIDVQSSILNSVKKLLGINPEDTAFDVDIITHINASLFTLYEIGVLNCSYIVESEENTYDDMLSGVSLNLMNKLAGNLVDFRNNLKSSIKLYLYYKTKLGFDPPASATVSSAIKESIAELEWRMNVLVDPPTIFEDGGQKDD